MKRRARLSVALLATFALAGCLRGSGALKPNNDKRDSGSDVLDAGSDQGNNGQSNNGQPADGGALDGNDGAPDATVSDMSGSDAGDVGVPDMPMFTPGVCGNDVVEFGETCDACALDCDDQNACTVDEPGGDPQTCTAFCWNRVLFDCIDGDGCCPSSCSSADDSDCSTTCGDGVLDAGETCDPVETCPTLCDDGDPSTRDVMTGTVDNCNVVCTYLPILRCIDADGYCPVGCSAVSDDDCDAVCGNGFTEPGETCDPPGSCPTTCGDGNPCTQDVMTGSAETCDVSCSNPLITACTSGDGCCADGCSAAMDADCSPTCGDRTLQANETCDGPAECNAIACDQGGVCTSAIRTGRHQSCNVQCGYAEIFSCQNDDGCCPTGCHGANDNDCEAVCGNDVVEPGEFCDLPGECETSCLDDGDVCTATEYVGDPATCDGRCTHPPITACGAAEGCCPPGCNANNDPDCSPVCGNAVVEFGEICDGNCPNCNDANACTVDVASGSAATCDLICQHIAITQCIDADGCCAPGCTALDDSDCAPICGNAVVEPGETCDQNCPASCDDQVACTADSSTGSAATCDLVCSNDPITTCTSGDGCCPANCTSLTDFDCP